MQDKRRDEEKTESQLKKQLAQEAARAELARDLTNEVHNLCGACVVSDYHSTWSAQLCEQNVNFRYLNEKRKFEH